MTVAAFTPSDQDVCSALSRVDFADMVASINGRIRSGKPCPSIEVLAQADELRRAQWDEALMAGGLPPHLRSRFGKPVAFYWMTVERRLENIDPEQHEQGAIPIWLMATDELLREIDNAVHALNQTHDDLTYAMILQEARRWCDFRGICEVTVSFDRLEVTDAGARLVLDKPVGKKWADEGLVGPHGLRAWTRVLKNKELGGRWQFAEAIANGAVRIK